MGAHVSSTTQQPVSNLPTLLLEACHNHSLRMEEGWPIKRLPLTCLAKLARNVNVQINVKPAEKKKKGEPHEQTIAINWFWMQLLE